MNKVILSGTIEKDLEITKTASNQDVCTAQLKCYNDETKRSFLLMDCVFWGEKAQSLVSIAKKGSYIEIEGKISKSNFKNKKGDTIYKTEVQVDRFEVVTGATATYSQVQEEQLNKQSSNELTYDFDDDVPF